MVALITSGGLVTFSKGPGVRPFQVGSGGIAFVELGAWLNRRWEALSQKVYLQSKKLRGFHLSLAYPLPELRPAQRWLPTSSQGFWLIHHMAGRQDFLKDPGRTLARTLRRERG